MLIDNNILSIILNIHIIIFQQIYVVYGKETW